MIPFLLVLLLIAIGCAIALVFVNKDLSRRSTIARAEVQRIRQSCDAEVARAFAEATAGVAEAQRLLNQQFEGAKQDAARIRQHYLDEVRRSQAAAHATVLKLRNELEPLRKYQGLHDAEKEAQAKLAAALAEATALTAEANAFLADARSRAAEERSVAAGKVNDMYEQANARLDQAIRDAGRILADAERRAKEIGGDAYAALREKRSLEDAVEAMRNTVEGYGDRYLVPTHTLLDTLAAEYGYDAAGQSLASAREQSRRMVVQGQAAACDYAEPTRRAAAVRFVVHAFNGSVDSILTKVKSDNFGVLQQRIRDAYSTVNLEGMAFRNARILPEYLDARLSELKWAVVVHELAQRDREEQRYQKEQERDRQKAEQERLRKLREVEKEKEAAAKEQQLKQAILAEAESRLALARSQDERQKAEQEVRRLQQEVAAVSQKLDDATKRELTIAQQTRKGRIYIISNVGSFGEGVYKIGLTRRAAEERVDELCNASVPFEFDIHGVIETDDAPALEYKIHQHFLALRLNKINLRKEFFRVSLAEIRKCVESLEKGKDVTGAVVWTEKARAQQYYESLHIERDGAEREKWLQRTRAIAERRQRQSLAGSLLQDSEASQVTDVPDRFAAVVED